MPRAVEAGHKLDAAAAAVDEEVRRHACIAATRATNPCFAGVELIHEEALDMATAIAARRQADVVKHDQADLRFRRTGVGVGRTQAVHPGDPAVRRYEQGRVPHARSFVPPTRGRTAPDLARLTGDSLDVQTLHPIAQLPERDAKQLRSGGAVVASLRERRANCAPLVFIEERGQRRRDAVDHFVGTIVQRAFAGLRSDGTPRRPGRAPPRSAGRPRSRATAGRLPSARRRQPARLPARGCSRAHARCPESGNASARSARRGTSAPRARRFASRCGQGSHSRATRCRPAGRAAVVPLSSMTLSR